MSKIFFDWEKKEFYHVHSLYCRYRDICLDTHFFMRRYTDSSVINGKVYVLGGINGSDNILNTLEVYDPTIEKWVLKKEMPTKRWGLSVTNLNNELYAIGGFVGVASLSVESTPRTEKYNPITDTWLTVPSMNTSRGSVR
ncbi:hypothetical protein J7E73_02175 [Paenibacillus albidus]|uniref:Kelch repeat-containing protein n=1 Tax=Paenibacillus albidus TaxID=2041023 RepID=UPI001BE82D88|nr:kelch repeat-containing protein [Paenibacillus albidus]MBT2287954.1 hypothetical protein [Paenibacillus albidus]